MTRGASLAAAALALCAAAPFVLSEFQATLAAFIGIAAIVSLGLVIMSGIAGQASFGQATFVGLAAYTTAILTGFHGWPPLAGLLPALLVTGGTAFLLGLITSRISGHYLPLATIAWCASFFYLFGVIPGLGGFNGFGEIPPLFPGITRGIAAGLVGAVLVGAYVACGNLLASRTGRAMRALAQSRIMADSAGIDTAGLARAVFVLAALLAGVAGWLFAHVQRYVSPSPFGLSASIEYVFMAVIGGVGHLAGAVIGAAVVVLLRDQLNDLLPRLLGSSGNFETVVFSLGVIALLQYAPRGIAAVLFRRARRVAVGPGGPPLARRAMPPRGALVLQTSALEKRFGGLVAAKSIDLSVRAGEIVALIGPNGAGKSTTFNLISGALSPNAGSVSLLGEPIHGRNARLAALRGLARTFQHVKLLPDASVLDNIALGAHLRGRAGMIRSMLRLDRAEERALLRAARAAAERVGLADALDSPAGSLPLGRQRLVEIARGLCLDPVVFLLDEPAAGLRLQEKQALATLLQALRDEGMAILLVEHDMDFVMGLADRVVVMDFGEKIADGRPQQVQDDRAVQEAYLGGVA
jgi:branched-chain amino acid transport system permease protein